MGPVWSAFKGMSQQEASFPSVWTPVEERKKPAPDDVGMGRAKAHLSTQEQALVTRLLEDYPNLDQLMAETVVWNYFSNILQPDGTETEPHTAAHTPEHSASNEGCSAPMPGTPSGGARLPPPTLAPPLARSGTLAD